MNNKLLNPFEKITGTRALAYGLIGLIFTTLFSYIAKLHAFGYFNYDKADNNELWYFVVERLIVWLVFAITFYIGGILFSKSKSTISDINVVGTTLFAQIPLLFIPLLWMLPPFSTINNITINDTTEAVELILKMQESNWFILYTFSSIAFWGFIVWSIILTYNAIRSSCNLKSTDTYIVMCLAYSISNNICKFLTLLILD